MMKKINLITLVLIGVTLIFAGCGNSGDKSAEKTDIQYIDLNRAYVHYFGEHSRGANYISAANLTKKNVVDRKAVTEEELNSVVVKDKHIRKFSSSIEKALNKVFGEAEEGEKIETIEIMEKYRKSGKQIFILFGHLFYDVGIDNRGLLVRLASLRDASTAGSEQQHKH